MTTSVKLNGRALMSNLNKPSPDIIVSLINRDNNSSINVNQVTFGQPESIVGSEERNTTTPVLAITEQGLTGSARVEYTRLDLSVLFDGITIKIKAPEEVSPDGILNVVNKLYGLQLSKDEIVNTEVDLTPNEDGKVMYTITAKDSIVYTGSFELELLVKPSVIAGAILTEAGGYLLTENGQPLLVDILSVDTTE